MLESTAGAHCEAHAPHCAPFVATFDILQQQGDLSAETNGLRLHAGDPLRPMATVVNAATERALRAGVARDLSTPVVTIGGELVHL